MDFYAFARNLRNNCAKKYVEMYEISKETYMLEYWIMETNFFIDSICLIIQQIA